MTISTLWWATHTCVRQGGEWRAASRPWLAVRSTARPVCGIYAWRWATGRWLPSRALGNPNVQLV